MRALNHCTACFTTEVFIDISIADVDDVDLRPLPIDCFFTDNSRAQPHDRNKQMVLRSS